MAKGKRVIRTYTTNGKPFTISTFSDNTRIEYYKPEISIDFKLFGLDSTLSLGRKDWEDLGKPKRIKVVIYNLDD